MLNKLLRNQLVIPLLLVFLWIAASIIAFFCLPQGKAKDFASFVSGLSTVGILILTTFYVIYTNKQINELQKQRQLQIQPLPNIEILEAAFTSPKIVCSRPPDIGVSLIVDFHLKYKIKNVGNGAAILVDSFAFFTGDEIKHIPEKYRSKRYPVLEVGKNVESLYRIRDDYFEAIKALNIGIEDMSCPLSQAFDVLVKFNILYKNIFGSPFLLNLLYVILITDENQKKLANWIASVDSFDNTFSDDISKFKAVTQRNRREGMDVLAKIKKTFYEKYPAEILSVEVIPLSQSFDVKPIEADLQKTLLDKIRHGIPMGKAPGTKEKMMSLDDLLRIKYFGLEQNEETEGNPQT